MSQQRFGACLPTFASCADRFCLSGYGGGAETVEGMLELATQVPDLAGVELVGNWHVNDDNIEQMRELLKAKGLQVPMMVPDLFTQAKWGRGSLAAPDAETRRAAVAEVKKVMDWAAGMGCEKVDVWPGQDGFDYAFQADYVAAWRWLVEGIRECADHRQDVEVCIEYKIKEPRTHCFVSTAAKTLLLVEEIGRPNVGILIDVGHAFAAGENVAEAIALVNGGGRKKLSYVHFNDNYRQWDDDMMVGSVHTIEYLELLYWLRRTGYDGWLTLDIFPYREDGIKAASESIEWLKGMFKVLEKMGEERIASVIASADATEASKLLRSALLPTGRG